jgi:hypothetical protein
MAVAHLWKQIEIHLMHHPNPKAYEVCKTYFNFYLELSTWTEITNQCNIMINVKCDICVVMVGIYQYIMRLMNGLDNELTPCRWVLLEMPPITQLLRNIPIFYGTRGLITVFTSTFRWSLSVARRIHTVPSYFSKVQFNFILSPTSRSSWSWIISYLSWNQSLVTEFLCIFMHLSRDP